MAGRAGRARQTRGRAGGEERGGQAKAARAPLGPGREGVRARHRGRQEDPRRALRRTLAAARLQRHVRPRLHARRLPRLQQPRGRAQRLARPPEPLRRDAALFLARADRSAGGIQGADGLGVPIRLDLQQRLRLRLRPRAAGAAGAADSGAQGDDRRPARLARGVVRPDRGRPRGRPAREPGVDRLRARERDRLPHVHRVGARPVRRAVLQLPARANAERAARRAAHPAEGRVPELTPTGLRRDGVASAGPASTKTVYAASGAGATSGGFSAVSLAGPGSHSSQLGRYQFRSPSSFIVAGRSTARTIVASSRIAVASPTPNCLKNSIESVAKIEKTATMTIAALVTTPALDLMPCEIASSMVAPRSNVSRIRLRMKTW